MGKQQQGIDTIVLRRSLIFKLNTIPWIDIHGNGS